MPLRMTCLLLLFASVASAQPARDGFRLLDGRWVRPAGVFEPPELIDVALVAGRLQVAFDPSVEWRHRLPDGRRVVAERGRDGPLWLLLLTPGRALPAVDGAANDAPTFVMLAGEAPVPQDDAPPRLSAVSVTPTDVRLRGIGRFEGKIALVEYRANADGASARLTVQLEGRGGLDVTGDSVAELLSRRPQLVRQFLSPIVRELAGADLLRPRPADVYRAFDAIEPTESELSALSAILPRLNDDDPLRRDQASIQLDAMGASGVLAALRVDLSRLPPEVSSRLSAFVARNSLGEIDPVAARSDLFFLREAMNDPDPRVREAAAEQLKLLEH